MDKYKPNKHKREVVGFGCIFETSISCGSELSGTPSRGKGLPLHPSQSALAPIMQVLVVKSFAQITNVTCFAPDSTDKVKMESVGTGRRSASYNCNLLGKKLWDN